MESGALDFFHQLLESPGPSGFEQGIQEVVRRYVGPHADELQTDLHGNVTAIYRPDADRRIMLAGHCDQIGMLISYIDLEGYLYAQTIGGWDPQQLVGQRMMVWGRGGGIPAVISRKPIHLQSDEERRQVVTLKELWLDIGATDRADAEQVVAVGDPVTLELGCRALRNNLATAPGMDNRAGVWVVMEAFRRAVASRPTWGVYAVSTVQEEIGLRGARTSAYRIDPTVGIAVDVTHATDCPTLEKNQHGDIRLGGGPVVFRGPNMNPHVTERLLELAKSNRLAVQPAAVGRATSNDANVIQISRSGVATGLVSIPNRYMHSAVETISLDDIDHAADLIARFTQSLTDDDDFVPRKIGV